MDDVTKLQSLSVDTLIAQHNLFLAVSQVRDLSETLRLCLNASLQVSGVECGGIYFSDPDGGLNLAQASGFSDEFLDFVCCHQVGSAHARLTMAGMPVYERPSDWEESLAEWEHREGLRAFALIPIRHKQIIIGCMIFASREVGQIPEENKIPLETMATVVGLLIGQARADEALRESEARFQATFEQAAVGIAQVALDGRWLRVNDRLCEIVGYERDELLSHSFQDLTSPADLAKDLDSMRRLLEGKIESYSREKRYFRKGGGTVWVNIYVALNRKQDGTPNYFIAVTEDIQARKQAEDVLRRYSRVVEQTASSVVITNTDGVIEYVNPRFTENTGYSAEEAIGENPRILKSGHTTEDEYRRLWETICAGHVWKGEFLNRRKDGSLYWESATISPIRDEYDQVSHFVAIKEDISERKYAAEALKKREARYRAVIDTAADGFWMLDQEGRILEVNDAYLRRSGYTRDELLSMRVKDVEAKESLDEVVNHIETIKRNGSDLFETQHRAKDGSKWPVEVNVSFWTDVGDRFFAFMRDISERKELERQIIEAGTSEQERIGREIHDGIGQQLTAVGMLARSLERRLNQEGQLSEARLAHDLVRHLRNTVAEAKALSRGLSPIEIGPNGLADALAILVEDAKAWSDVCTRLSISGDLGIADERVTVHLFRIAQEAINNAIKHAQAHNIDVRLWGGRNSITLSVYDDGIGIGRAKYAKKGLGTRIMRYRADIIGASFSISSATGDGTLVECTWHRS